MSFETKPESNKAELLAALEAQDFTLIIMNRFREIFDEEASGDGFNEKLKLIAEEMQKVIKHTYRQHIESGTITTADEMTDRVTNVAQDVNPNEEIVRSLAAAMNLVFRESSTK